jgi:arsenate reductase-like glutaredoxin family protein
MPTGDQLNSILEYLGPNTADSVVEGATGASDALKLFKQNEVVIKRPIVVDWNNGRAGMSVDCYKERIEPFRELELEIERRTFGRGQC